VALDDDDVEAIARRVAELLQPPVTGVLVDARRLAAMLGVERDWIYTNAERLGGVRLGPGPKARLRFDVDRARAAVDGTLQGDGAPPTRLPAARRGRPRTSTGPVTPAAQRLLRGRAR